MAIDADDWTITRSTKVIAYTGDDHHEASPTYATVIDFHRWLQGLADDAVASGDDELDITNTDPSRRSTDNIVTLINGYTIGNTEAEHLYDGSIIYDGGDEVYDGIVNFGNLDVQIQIIQDGAVLSDDWWNHGDGVYGDGGLNYDANAGISHRFMIKTRTGGADVDGRRLIGTCRRFLYTYSEFSINGTARGNNVLALNDSLDLNNETAAVTVSGWSGITNVKEGYSGIDVDNNGSPEYYYSEWNTNQPTRSINDFYERMKLLSSDGSGETLYGLNGELFRGITHQVVITPGTGTWEEPESLSWGTAETAGTGQLLAVDNTDATGTGMLWMQILTGVIPAANLITGNNGATGTAGTVTERTISKPFCGQSTGSAIIGSYGFGLEKLDLTSNDKVFDLGNNPIEPPNNVTNTVSGVVSGSDRILVAPWDGTSTDVNGDPEIDKDQLTLLTNLTADDITSVAITGSIPTDTPSPSGYIRLADDNGFERRLRYTSWTTGASGTFTINTTDGNEDFNTVNATAGNDVYIGYIDVLTKPHVTSESFTSVQSGSRDLVVIVRDGGATPIKQFISSWSQTDSNASISVIRTTDL